jgi:hypothetical protein
MAVEVLSKECAIHTEWLQRIERGIEDLNEKVDIFVALDGPVGQIRERVTRLEDFRESHSDKMGIVEGDIKERGVALNALIVKVAVITALLSSGAFAGISHWFP